jgi:hypothetical protein
MALAAPASSARRGHKKGRGMRSRQTPEARKEQNRADQARYRARHPEERRAAAKVYNAKRRAGIDDSDKMAGLEAARYRCAARMRELEVRFENEASRIRAEFVAECSSVLAEATE